ncbi:MerR family transcriptional regulator [Candidatus Enterococcus ikei]|uniref:MerR family transcriptional regulator n=1 Tax=Candidatus Enterococcus ikei TaxID=2815326 RepID=A0ABS3H1P2_9ENTE|nr:MerR family transcriptional regulator [Enterococcus sp. DIV0869a]MBO0441089.1 MerR family transcriptional regulator [Enterococcus sp. DIV0869a]
MNSKEAAEMFGLTTDTVRYYERVGVIPPIKRDKNGYRVYTTRDLNWIYLAKSLRHAGVSIESLIEFATLSQLGGNVEQAQKQILQDQLQEITGKLEEMTKTRDLLQYKIDTYDEHIAKFKSGEVTSDNVEELWKVNHKK